MTKSKTSYSTKKAEYSRRASEAWDQAWDIYKDTVSWHCHSGTQHLHPANGKVLSKKIKGYGKVFKLEAQLAASPETVFEVLVTGVNEWPLWNPTILECKPIETLDENTDLSYSVGAPAVGGLVSSRDFVNLRHWKSRDGIMMSSACGALHASMPESKNHIRGENKPASYVFAPVPNEPDQCQFTCILNTDLKGWLPQFLIDQAMSGVLLDYLRHLNDYLVEFKASHQISQPPATSSEAHTHGH